MPNFDDLLTRELERAGRPAAPDLGRVEGEVRRRRARRGVVRRVQAGALTVAVLAATVSGFVVLRNQFADDPDGVAGGSPYGAGGIVAACPMDDGTHLCVVPANSFGIDAVDGRRLLTEGGGEVVAEPDVSPDGTTVVFHRYVAGDESMSGIWTVQIDGTSLTQITRLTDDLWSASWSPDGSRLIAIRARDGGTALAFLTPDGTLERTYEVPGLTNLASPRWAPDGSRIAFKAVEPSSGILTADIFTIAVDGTELMNLTGTRFVQERDTAWSPDGASIAYTSETPDGPRIHVRRSDGIDEILLGPDGNPVEGSSPDWSPDGTWIAYHVAKEVPEAQAPEIEQNPVLGASFVSARAARVDGSRDVLLAPAVGLFAWIPAAEGPIPSPEPSPTPEPEGRDIGLDFRICDVETLGGLSLIGGGPAGRAWTGVPVTGEGACPESSFGKVILAVDHTGDGLADSWWGPIEGCDFCRPLGATDLDVDGIDEIVVQNGFSIADHWIFRVPLDEGAAPHVEPILVAPPGHEPAGLPGGEPLVVGVGGDAGYSGYMRCETYPESPILVYTWIFAEVDASSDQQVHETRLSLGDDGMFHVVGTNDFTVPRGNDIPLELSRARACGVDWDLFA